MRKTQHDDMFVLMYESLRELAGNLFRNQRRHHTLRPTEVVHEIYPRLAKSNGFDCKNQTHFLRTCARAMNQCLIDYARRRAALRNRPPGLRVSVESLSSVDQSFDELMDALEKLRELNPQHHEVVVLRFFSGLTMPEIARTMDLGLRTVEGYWRTSRAWLRCQLGNGTR